MTQEAPLGCTLRLWRLKRGLTQVALANRVRMSRPNLSAVERGKREVSLGTLRALAAGLQIRPGVLVDGVTPFSPRALQRASTRVDRLLHVYSRARQR